MRRTLELIIAAAASIFAGCATGEAPAPQSIAIVGGLVVDPATEAAPAPATVIIADGRVAAVGADARIPRGARIIDAHGKYLVPGLWDMHAHIATAPPIGRAPENYVGFGVLGIRDMGGDLPALTQLRTEIASGSRVGPDLYYAGPTLNGEAAAPWHRVVRTPAEARTAVRELHAAGVDFIKTHRATPRDAFFAMVEEARAEGLAVVGHVPLALSWPEAATAGMRSMEHAQTLLENEISAGNPPAANALDAMARIDGPRGDEVFAALVQAHAFFDPTLAGYESTINNRPEVAAQRRALFEHLKAYVKRASDAHVQLLAGTDVLDHFGDMLLTEEERLVDAGLTPRQALRAATSTPAALMQRRDLGRIGPGAEASLLVLEADPTTDIAALRRLSLVVLRGRVIMPAELAELRR